MAQRTRRCVTCYKETLAFRLSTLLFSWCWWISAVTHSIPSSIYLTYKDGWLLFCTLCKMKTQARGNLSVPFKMAHRGTLPPLIMCDSLDEDSKHEVSKQFHLLKLQRLNLELVESPRTPKHWYVKKETENNDMKSFGKQTKSWNRNEMTNSKYTSGVCRYPRW